MTFKKVGFVVKHHHAEASRLALDAAAFEPAADYAELALELAPRSPRRGAWLHHAARMAYLAGRPARMDALLESALAAALADFDRTRLREGEALERDLAERIDSLRGTLGLA